MSTTTVFKYKLEGLGPDTFDLPLGARVLSCEFQRGGIVVWIWHRAPVDGVTFTTIGRTFQAFETGKPLPPTAQRYIGTAQSPTTQRYIGTAQCMGMSDHYVLHVFELTEVEP